MKPEPQKTEREVAILDSRTDRDEPVDNLRDGHHVFYNFPVFSPILLNHEEFVSRIVDQLTKTMDSIFESFSEECKNLDKKIAERGWFPDPDMPMRQRFILAQSIDQDPVSIDRYMSDTVSDRLDRIEIDLLHAHSKREKIIADAFEAHRREKYSLSVPVFISQAEGLLYEAFDKSVFMTRERNRIHNEAESYADGPIDGYFFYLLSVDLPIWRSKNQRDGLFQGLNRHEVLHGVSLDYATKTNSLKAISFLRWVSWLVDWIDTQSARLK